MSGILSRYLSLVRFSHTVFALPFAGIGFVLAIEESQIAFSWLLLIKVLLCMVFARTAAMSFNRWADRKIDARNPRTALREIPAGLISADAALLFTLSNCIGFVATTMSINPLCFGLSFVALGIILGYSYTKRLTPLCHLILGAGLALAPTGAWLAVTGSLNWLPVQLSIAVLCWVSGFDIIYALQDEEFDRNNNLYSIPVFFGGEKALMIARLLHITSAVFLFTAGLSFTATWLYFLGWLIFCLLLIYQHRLISPGDLSRINLAFGTTNGIASIVFSLFVIADRLI